MIQMCIVTSARYDEDCFRCVSAKSFLDAFACIILQFTDTTTPIYVSTMEKK